MRMHGTMPYLFASNQKKTNRKKRILGEENYVSTCGTFSQVRLKIIIINIFAYWFYVIYLFIFLIIYYNLQKINNLFENKKLIQFRDLQLNYTY